MSNKSKSGSAKDGDNPRRARKVTRGKKRIKSFVLYLLINGKIHSVFDEFYFYLLFVCL